MMLILKNFTQYIPEYADLMIPALYFQSEEGEDWYFHRMRFSDDTLKVCYDNEGVIRSFGFDASRLYPGGYSVAEVEKNAVPEDISIDGSWMFDGSAIVPRTYTQAERVELADKKRLSLIADAVAEMSPLSDAAELGRATTEQSARLTALKNYRLDLIELDVSDPDNIVWPELNDVA
ncbi:tail fiber assembly protein [Pantoea vagans]|uniref:tail fiber assembly protein n=1 Tax=Pantoea vagans TaxID=470934 RepID=UPI002251F0B2|nr:tail fiber assembly protein [Pantoea vagans]MCX3308048.1 tail fiber assembly protein [Pantoea vagans]